MRPIASAEAREPATMRDGVIAVHIRELAQLFDSMDPCPFYERDLDADAEDYIVGSARELPKGAVSAILVHLGQRSDQDEQGILERAIHGHFSRKAQLTSRELHELLRRGWISLAIGLVFFATLLVASEAVVRRMEAGPFATVLRESLVIGGWVAMWRPLEIFLYDWWPVAGRRRLFAALSQVPVLLEKSRP